MPLKNKDKRKNYFSFLLRLWQVEVDGKHVWYASLENSSTGERKSFSSLKEMLSYLKKQMRIL